MTHTLVNTWAVGDPLTSAQINQLASDVAGSLDKSVAGDTLLGVIFLNTGAQIVAAGPSGAGGTILAGASGIQGYQAGAIQGTVAGAISLTTATDFVALTVARTRTLCYPMLPTNVVSGWTTQTGGQLIASATGTLITLTIPQNHNGSTLTSASVYFIVENTHASLPASLPAFNLARRKLSTGASSGLYSAGTIGPTPGSVAAYNNSLAIQSFGANTDQNNVIDTSQYYYYLTLQDESGANSIAGNVYVGFSLTFGNITSMMFP